MMMISSERTLIDNNISTHVGAQHKVVPCLNTELRTPPRGNVYQLNLRLVAEQGSLEPALSGNGANEIH